MQFTGKVQLWKPILKSDVINSAYHTTCMPCLNVTFEIDIDDDI